MTIWNNHKLKFVTKHFAIDLVFSKLHQLIQICEKFDCFFLRLRLLVVSGSANEKTSCSDESVHPPPPDFEALNFVSCRICRLHWEYLLHRYKLFICTISSTLAVPNLTLELPTRMLEVFKCICLYIRSCCCTKTNTRRTRETSNLCV